MVLFEVFGRKRWLWMSLRIVHKMTENLKETGLSNSEW